MAEDPIGTVPQNPRVPTQATITSASVQVGSIPFDSTDSLFAINDDPFGIYVDYIIKSRYEKDGHIYSIGIASPSGFQGDSVAFVQLSNSTLLWFVDWTACRLNQPPPIPDPTPNGPNWVLLDTCLEPAMVLAGPDSQTPMYRISGTYVYGSKNPSASLIDDVTFSRPPWLEDVLPYGRTADGSLFRKSLID